MGTLFSKRQKWWGQLFFICGNIMFVSYFFYIGLYGNMLLFGVYVLLCLWTIFQWTRRDSKTQKFLSPSGLGTFWRISLLVGLAVVMLIAMTGGFIHQPQTLPLARALDFGMLFTGLSGQLLLARKKIDSWVAWMLGDIMAMVLFSMTGQWFLLGRAVITFSVGGSALLEWRKDMKAIAPMRNR